MQGTLYLIPSLLGEGEIQAALPGKVQERISSLSTFIVEHPKTARRFLKLSGTQKPLQGIEMRVLDEHTRKEAMEALLEPLLEGRDVGLLSEAGCPAVADPGAELVALAHRKGIRVVPLVGPSSILLALMASGLGGQRFSFHGYLPVEGEEQAQKIRELERGSRERDETVIFIETPYRNDRLFANLLKSCGEATRLCIASDLTLPTESVLTKSIGSWKKILFRIGKKPAVFLIKG